MESIRFEVVPFKSAYHAIFGRPAFAKFMARPCYIYSKLKMLGPNGTITINGNFKKAKECERGNAAFVEAILHAEELADMRKDGWYIAVAGECGTRRAKEHLQGLSGNQADGPGQG